MNCPATPEKYESDDDLFVRLAALAILRRGRAIEELFDSVPFAASQAKDALDYFSFFLDSLPQAYVKHLYAAFLINQDIVAPFSRFFRHSPELVDVVRTAEKAAYHQRSLITVLEMAGVAPTKNLTRALRWLNSVVQEHRKEREI